jgi:hypothetical protein
MVSFTPGEQTFADIRGWVHDHLPQDISLSGAQLCA